MNDPLPFKDKDVLDSSYQFWDSPFVVKQFMGDLRLVPIRKRHDHPSAWPTVHGLLRSKAPFRVFGHLRDNDTISLY